MCTLRVATVVLLCAVSQDALALEPPPPTPVQLREWGRDECVSAGKRAGIDYTQALNRAIAKDPAGLATLFGFTNTPQHHAAAGEAHDQILCGLLQRWGDRSFAHVLRSQKLAVRKAVVGAIFAFWGWKPIKFPLTYASAPH